eukprot:g8597.t1
MSEQVDVTSEGLTDLSRALTKKRLEYVKLTNTLNEPPRGVGDLITQTRDFTEKLKQLLSDGSEVSDQVRRELVDENGFPGQVERLPLDSLYNDVTQVKEELRIADGYQPYLVAPESGLRRLFRKSVESLLDPVRDLVEQIHELVATAVDRALKESCQVPQIEKGTAVARFPNFIDNVLPVALDGLEALKKEAEKMAIQVVEMEGSFVTCSFFRYLTFKRIRDAEEAFKQLSSGIEGRRGRTRTDEDDDDDDDDDGEGSVAETEVSLPPVLPGDYVPNVYQSADAVFGMSGYLQKSSTHSRNKMTKTEMSLWQRRFFGVRDSTKTLEYYHNEEAFLKGTLPGVTIHLMDCIVSDTDGTDVLPQSTLSRSKEHLDAETQVSLLVLIQTKDPKKNIYKNSKDLILRAENAAEKFQWLSYLKTSSNDTRSGVRVASWVSKDLVSNHTSETSDVSVRERSRPASQEDYDDFLGQGQGLGAAIFWNPICRDQNNGLIPSPGIYMEGGDQDLSMEKAIIQHAADMKAYTKLVCETLVMTIPKVIVHCLVDKATERLGPKVEEHILGLPQEVREMLLHEDNGVAIHRDKVNETIKRIGKAEETIKEAGRSMGESVHVKIDMSIIELAGLSARLKKRDDGSYSFINKPPPPVSNRNKVTESNEPITGQNQQRPVQRQTPVQPINGSGSQRPRRNAPSPPPLAAQKSVTVAANGQPTTTSLPSPQGTGKGQQQGKTPPQGSTWYGFRPFNR